MKTLTFSEAYEKSNAFSNIGLCCLTLGIIILCIGLATQSPPTAAGGGAFIAIAASMLTLWIQSRKEIIDNSKFFLDSAVAGFKSAHNLLEVYERTRWVAAARIILHIREIREKITEPEHQTVFRMHFEDMRLKVGKLLGHRLDDPKTFFGDSADTLYLAARKSTEGTMGTHFIDLDVLAVLYDFAQQTDEKDDALDGWAFNDQQKSGMEFIYPGLYRYIGMHEDHYFRDGKIIRKSDGEEVEVTDRAFKDNNSRSNTARRW